MVYKFVIHFTFVNFSKAISRHRSLCQTDKTDGGTEEGIMKK